MFSTNFDQNTELKKIISVKNNFAVIEYLKDMSVLPENAMRDYFAAAMNVRKRQLAISLENGEGAIIQAGAMQWMVGDVEATTNVKGIGDLIGKAVSAKVTKETTIKPKYTCKTEGAIILEPTYKHIIIEDVASWGEGLIIEDGLFLACSDTVKISTVARDTISSAVLGNQGLFNTMLSGNGIVALESNIPYEELVLVELQNDVLKIDGALAVAWSKSLNFTVGKTTKTLLGSAVSKEGLVNVYKGTGKVLMAPIA